MPLYQPDTLPCCQNRAYLPHSHLRPTIRHGFLDILFALGRESVSAMITATGTSTLGLLVWIMGLILFVWLIRKVWTFVSKRRSGKNAIDSINSSLEGAGREAGIGITAFAVLVVLAWGAFVPKTIYEDHQSLTSHNAELVKKVQDLSSENPYEKSFVGSYAYTNTIGAFRSILMDARRQPDSSSECQLKITSVAENRATALSLRSIASALGCNIQAEPYDPDMDPESANEIRQSLPNFIVIHARKENIGADGFVVGMSNTFHVQRAYDLPPKSSENLVWLQIGPNSIWRPTK